MTDDALEADLRRVAASVDPAPRPATPFTEERDALDCSAYPEGSSRHDYRRTASRPGEAAWKCRSCGDVFVALDSEVRALDAEDWDG